MPKIALNLISGALGAGKTTLIKNLLQQKPQSEHWVLLVNEYGAVGIDGAILSNVGKTETYQIPGGCICCTALPELENTLQEIVRNQQPDRIIIEPTGLAEPDSIVDILQSQKLKSLFEIQSLISVFDAANTQIEDLENMVIMKSLLNMADIILINKTDIATTQQTQALLSFCENLFPPKRLVSTCQNGQLNITEITYPHFQPQTFQFSKIQSPSPMKATPHAVLEKSSPPDYPFQNLPELENRAFQRSQSTLSAGWVFTNDAVFNWKKIQTEFESFSNDPAILRAKAIFKVGRPRMLFQYVHGNTTREIVAYRKDSRIEILLAAENSFNFEKFEKMLMDAITV